METHLHQELENLNREINKMFSLTESALDSSIRSMLLRDDIIAGEVLEGDRKINEMQVEIEERTLHILALWQPVATDLRFVLACARVANDLERVGDLSTNIAESALMLNSKPRVSFMNVIQDLTEVVKDMFGKALNAFWEQNSQMAYRVYKKDLEANELNVKIIKNLIDYMTQESIMVERAVHSIIVANSLERIGDLSTNIGEDVVFISQGINVKHSQKFDWGNY